MTNGQPSGYGSSSKPNPQNAAVNGAAAAYNKAPPQPKPKPASYNGDNGGALAAARGAGGAGRSQATTPRPIEIPKSPASQRQRTRANSGSGAYGKGPDAGNVRERLQQLSDVKHLQLPGGPTEQPKSPSIIASAAALAASRCASAAVSPNQTGQAARSNNSAAQNNPRIQRSRRPSRSSRAPSSIESFSLDENPIPPTASLIGLFEQKEPNSNNKRPTSPIVRSSIAEIVSPKPTHQNLPAKIILHPEIATRMLQKPPLFDGQNSSRGHSSSSNQDSQTRAAGRENTMSKMRPPIPPPPRRRPSSNPGSKPSSYTTVDTLANAMVAGSLATSRANSPAKAPTPHPQLPPRRKASNSLFVHQPQQIRRTPSPSKGLRTTLRKPMKPEEEEETRHWGRKHLMKKHPHKHHEGDRKRWRDEVTERERKRYEGVWASNRGTFPSANSRAYDESETVINLVVRDIWSRSRLGPDVLEEVYDLVDRSHSGRLDKDEFVVGLWLIDQRLKGRKLPIRVSESVWHSVGKMSGFKQRNGVRIKDRVRKR